MAKLDINAVLLIGGVALGGYALYRWFNSAGGGIKEASEGLGGGIGTAGEGLGGGIGAFGDFLKTLFDTSASGFAKLGDGGSYEKPPEYNNIDTPVTFNNPITSVMNTGKAYGFDTVTLKNAAGKQSTIIAAPKTYYKELGVGFNSKGQGYSSAFAGNKPTNATSIFTNRSY